MANGLQALHHRNIVHRDIKINNILVASNEGKTKVSIGDLGSAIKLQSAEGTSNFQIGTPGYLPPEIIIGAKYSFGYDVWSLGCLMYLLLSS